MQVTLKQFFDNRDRILKVYKDANMDPQECVQFHINLTFEDPSKVPSFENNDWGLWDATFRFDGQNNMILEGSLFGNSPNAVTLRIRQTANGTRHQIEEKRLDPWVNFEFGEKMIKRQHELLDLPHTWEVESITLSVTRDLIPKLTFATL